MTNISRRLLCQSGLAAGLGAFGFPATSLAHVDNPKFICPPCGCAMDGQDFDKPGFCPACGMALIPKLDFGKGALPEYYEHINIAEGSGHFVIPGSRSREEKRIGIWYHKPSSFVPDSPILIIVPGAGRNGHNYRDAWIKAADHFGIFVAALAYPRQTYGYSAYNMGGVIKNFDVRNLERNADGSLKAHYFVRDEDISFDLNTKPHLWLFNDFDRIFEILKKASGSNRSGYDLFGHSAGAQLLHRAALLQNCWKANRIVAANSGSYSLPDTRVALIGGLRDTGATEETIARAFRRKLMILLGKKDDRNETRGTLLHTPKLDKQGLGRVDRGRYFYRQSKEYAAELGAQFNWDLHLVPDVGHDYRAMSKAAGKLLYGSTVDMAKSRTCLRTGLK